MAFNTVRGINKPLYEKYSATALKNKEDAKMKKIDIEVKNEIKRMLIHGDRGYEIAERTGVSTWVVTQVRKQLQREGFDIWHKGGVIASRMY